MSFTEYESLPILLETIKQCNHCADQLALGPNPVVQAHASANILIIGQAPGAKVHASGIPWDDVSGDRLRKWLGIEREVFYNPQRVAIMPMGFCYPGKGKSGDLPPNKECAPRWHNHLLSFMPNIQLTLLIGQYAQNYYLPNISELSVFKKLSLTERVKQFPAFPEHIFMMPHPSPRNQIWLKRNPWFEAQCIPVLKSRIHTILSTH